MVNVIAKLLSDTYNSAACPKKLPDPQAAIIIEETLDNSMSTSIKSILQQCITSLVDYVNQ